MILDELKIFDGVTEELYALLSHSDFKDITDAAKPVNDVGNHVMILRGDMAYELGVVGKKGVGWSLVTKKEQIKDDRIFLLGKDLSEIKADCNYARISVVKLKESEACKDEQGLAGDKLYGAIRAIEYVRHHIFPEGFMMRISSAQNIESVRVAKSAVKAKLSFADVGELMLKQYHKNPLVEAVHIYYITEDYFEYDALKKFTEKSEAITRTIDHILKNAGMDCDSCNLSEICNEVEGLRELHFSQR